MDGETVQNMYSPDPKGDICAPCTSLVLLNEHNTMHSPLNVKILSDINLVNSMTYTYFRVCSVRILTMDGETVRNT